MRNLSQANLRSISIELPSDVEREEIVRRVETLFAYADRLEARYKAAREAVERLTPALLAKAFRGELVPQDPNDEPASVLLERIRKEREANTPTPKAARQRPAAPVEKIQAPEPPPEPVNGHRTPPPDIEQIDRETLLATMREVFQNGTRLEADSAIRTVAHALGFARTGSRIEDRWRNTLRVAVQRRILANKQGAYRLDRRSIADYEREEILDILLAAMPRAWVEREEAIRAAARHLGFRRTGPALQEAFKSAINGAIRRGLIESNKDWIRKNS